MIEKPSEWSKKLGFGSGFRIDQNNLIMTYLLRNVVDVFIEKKDVAC